MAGLEAAEAGAEAEACPEVAAGADGEPPAGAAQATTINAAPATMAQRPRPVCRLAPVASERVARDGFCPIDGPSSAVRRRGAGPRLPPENRVQPCQTRDGIGARRVVQRLQIGGSARESDGSRSRNRRIGVVRWGIAALRGDAPRGRS